MCKQLDEATDQTTLNLRCKGCDRVWEFTGTKLDALEQTCGGCGSTDVHRDWKAEKDAKGDFIHRERSFYGETVTESRMHGCHPKEVAEMRRLIGGEEARAIKDNGQVHFRTRSQQRAYTNRVAQLMRQGVFYNPAMGHR